MFNGMLNIILVVCTAAAAVQQTLAAGPVQLVKPGYFRTASGTSICPKGTFNTGTSVRCTPCDKGFTTLKDGATAKTLCTLVQPGWAMDLKSKTPKPCDKGTWSSGGTAANPNGVCAACPTGFTTQEAESDRAADCEVCTAGRGGSKCELCVPGTFSYGGVRAGTACRSCEPGLTSARGSSSSEECVEAMIQPSNDYFPISDDEKWKQVAQAGSFDACAAACQSSSSSSAVCVMYRWSENEGVCQHLQDENPGQLLGFKVANGADFVIYNAPVDVGELLGSQSRQSMKQCMQACLADNACEGFSFPSYDAVGTCKLFASVLDADYQGKVNVAGSRLYAGGRKV